MLIYARVALVLTPTGPPPPFSGYLFPELRYISLVLISRTNITFFHYIQREFPIRLPAGYFRLWTRDREIPRREITCGSRPFSHGTFARFLLRTIEKEFPRNLYWQLWHSF